jgi:hypothetical protein
MAARSTRDGSARRCRRTRGASRGALAIAVASAVAVAASFAPATARAQTTIVIRRFDGPQGPRARAALARELGRGGVVVVDPVAGSDEALAEQARASGASAIVGGTVSHVGRRWRVRVDVRSLDGWVLGEETWGGRSPRALDDVGEGVSVRLRAMLAAVGAPPPEVEDEPPAPEPPQALRPQSGSVSAHVEREEPHEHDDARDREVGDERRAGVGDARGDADAGADAGADLDVDVDVDAEPSAMLPAASAQLGGAEIGFDTRDGAYIRTPDRAWSLRIGFFWLFRAQLTNGAGADVQLQLLPLQQAIYVTGSALLPWLRYTAFIDVAPPHSFLAWADARPHEAFGVRAGFFRPAFTRSMVAFFPYQLMLDRSDATRAFVTRAIPAGVMVLGTPAEGQFEYYVAVHDGNGALMGVPGSASPMPVIRLAANPFGSIPYSETTAIASPRQPGRLQIAVMGYYNRHGRAATATEPAAIEELFTAGGDVTLAIETVYVTGEVYYRHRRVFGGASQDALGAMGMAAWMFFAPYLEAAIRASVLVPDIVVASELRQTYDVALHVFPLGANNLKLQVRYTLSIDAAPLVTGTPETPWVVPGGTLVHSGSITTQFFF